MSEVLGSKRNEGQEQSGVIMTGLRQVKFVCVNPDAAKLEEMYGKPPSKDPDYSIIEKNGFEFRPVTFFFQDTLTKKYVNLRLSIGQEVKEQPLDKDGNKRNYKILTSNGNVTWACDTNKVVKQQFEDYSPLRMGEDTVIAIVQAVTHYDYKSGQDFIVATNQLRLTAKHLFEGDYSGFNNLPTEYPTNELIVQFLVSEGDAGKYYQNVASNPECFFADKYGKGVTDFHVTRLKDRFNNGMAATKPFNMFEGFFYTFDSQVFSPTTSMGGVPKNSVASAPAANWND